MKRCPQCFFIYPGTDSICDFDQTPLVSVTEAEIAAVTSTEPTLKNSTPSQNRKSWRGFLLSGAIGLLLGMVIVGVYIAVHRQMNPTPSQVQLKAPTSQRLIAPSPSPSATVIVQTATPEPTVEATKSTLKTATAHSSTSTGSVSTSAPNVGEAKSGKSVILLSSGGKVEADEVWRTKDGIWYRRDGIVTLLKKARVKAIVRQ
jgi:cytoskeletal protein RodZ